MLPSYYYSILENFIQTYEYLFSIKLNRVALFHDSFNTYLFNNITGDENLKKEMVASVTKSIDDGELRFMCRLNSFPLTSEYKQSLIKKYMNFDALHDLAKSTFDYEAIEDFYKQLHRVIEESEPDFLNVLEYYEYCLMTMSFYRMNITQSYGLIYQLLCYLKNKIDINNNLYSNGEVFDVYFTLKTQDYEHYLKKLKDSNYDGINELNQMYETINEEGTFFSSFSINVSIDEYFEKNITNGENELDKNNCLKKILVYIYLNNIEYKNYLNMVTNYIKGAKQIALHEFYGVLINLGINTYQPDSILRDIKDTIFQLGYEKDSNPYYKNLDDFIWDNRLKGSFTVDNKLTAYIRLANYEKRTIDVEYMTCPQSLVQFLTYTFINDFYDFALWSRGLST